MFLQEERSLIEKNSRLFWVSFLAISTFFAGFVSYNMATRIADNSIVVSRSNKAIDISDIPFPAFTYCDNLNPDASLINFTYAQELANSNKRITLEKLAFLLIFKIFSYSFLPLKTKPSCCS